MHHGLGLVLAIGCMLARPLAAQQSAGELQAPLRGLRALRVVIDVDYTPNTGYRAEALRRGIERDLRRNLQGLEVTDTAGPYLYVSVKAQRDATGVIYTYSLELHELVRLTRRPADPPVWVVTWRRGGVALRQVGWALGAALGEFDHDWLAANPPGR